MVFLWTKTGRKIMNARHEKDENIRPDLIRRTGGGWLAVAPTGSFLSIGVTAQTQEEAVEKFRTVFSRWVEILDGRT
jgi:hypothetical protein